MDVSEPSPLNFSSQESLFPHIPPNVNAFKSTLDDTVSIVFHPRGSDSDAMLAQYLIGIIILGAGIILSLATLIIGWINARKLGKSFNLVRKIQRIEGTYYSVENAVFIPLTMFLYWIGLFGQLIVMMMYAKFGRSMYNTSIWELIPFTIMFIQGHGFAFSILIGGIVTYDSVRTTRKLKLPPAWFLNFLQGALAIATIVTSIYFGMQTNRVRNEAWRLYTTAKPIIEAAADSWVANGALNASLSEPAYIAITEFAQPSLSLINNLRKTVIVWLFVAGLPLLTLIIAAGVLLQTVHSYVKEVKSDITNGKQETTTAEEMSSSVVNSTLESKHVKTYGLHQTLQQMRTLERKMALRMFALCFVSMTYTILTVVVVAEYHYVTGSKNSQLPALFYLIKISFPWVSIIYGSVVIVSWLRSALKQFREGQAKDKIMTLSGKIGRISSSYTEPSTFQSLSDKDAIVNHEKYTIPGIEITHTSYSVKEELHDIPMKTFQGNPVAY